MHPYTIDTKEREETLKYLALLAIVFATAFSYLIQIFKIVIPWYVDPPAIAGFFGIAFWLFDHLLWHIKVGPLSLSRIPDIRGTWGGRIRSSFQNMEIPVVVHIRQGWGEMSIELETESSHSSTVMAALAIEKNSLRYEYLSEPKHYGSTPNHAGSAHLHLSRNRKMLKGQYYTSEGSNNTGTIILDFLDREMIDHEDALRRMQAMVITSKT